MATKARQAKKQMTYMEGESAVLLLSSWIFITIASLVVLLEICRPFFGRGERNYFLMLVCMSALIWYLILWARHSQVLSDKDAEIRQLRQEIREIREDHGLSEKLFDPALNDEEEDERFKFNPKDQGFLDDIGFSKPTL